MAHPFAFLLFFLFISSTFPLRTDNNVLSLPKRASLQQVLAFLKELKKMMKESPPYRLHKRGVPDCCSAERDENAYQELASLVSKRLRSRSADRTKYFPLLNRFRPSYTNLVEMMNQVGK